MVKFNGVYSRKINQLTTLMACYTFGGSCSLCPWCGDSKRCPNYKETDYTTYHLYNCVRGDNRIVVKAKNKKTIYKWLEKYAAGEKTVPLKNTVCITDRYGKYHHCGEFVIERGEWSHDSHDDAVRLMLDVENLQWYQVTYGPDAEDDSGQLKQHVKKWRGTFKITR